MNSVIQSARWATELENTPISNIVSFYKEQ